MNPNVAENALRKFFLMAWFSCFFIQAGLAQKIKVACIGDSVTFGFGIDSRNRLSYPGQLQDLLGDNYAVSNFGKNGTTLLRNGHNPYFKTEEFKQALAFRPDVVVIHLGLNDTDPRNWPSYQSEFEQDYAALIDTLKQINPATRILLAELSPIFSGHPRFKSGTRDWHKEIRLKIRKVATDHELELVDFFAPLHSRPDLLPDQLHPNVEGARILSQAVYSKITGDFGGFQLDKFFQNGAVIQQSEKVWFFGKGNPEDTVQVDFQEKKGLTRVDQNGKWMVALEGIKAGGPFPLKIESPKGKMTLDSLWVGEVWLAMGQSNMDWPLSQSNDGTAAANLSSEKDPPHFYMFRPQVPMDQLPWDEETLKAVQNLDFFEEKWLSVEELPNASGVAYFFGKRLQETLEVPVGIIQISVGGAPIESFLSRASIEQDDLLVDMLKDWKKSDFIMPWVRSRVAENLGDQFESPQRHPFEPAYLHESMLSQVRNIPIKGVIWYQGESNVHHPDLYRTMFEKLRKDLQEVFGKTLPIFTVQLPGMSRPEWPYFREIQEELANDLTDVYLISSIDLGDSLDVHPRNKKEVGLRLASQALHLTYGLKKFPIHGPKLLSISQDRNQLVLYFEAFGKLQTRDNQPITELEIIASKGRKIPIVGKIEGNHIFIPLPHEVEAEEIWFGFSPFPRINLTDESGWPAAPFRFELTQKPIPCLTPRL